MTFMSGSISVSVQPGPMKSNIIKSKSHICVCVAAQSHWIKVYWGKVLFVNVFDQHTVISYIYFCLICLLFGFVADPLLTSLHIKIRRRKNISICLKLFLTVRCLPVTSLIPHDAPPPPTSRV